MSELTKVYIFVIILALFLLFMLILTLINSEFRRNHRRIIKRTYENDVSYICQRRDWFVFWEDEYEVVYINGIEKLQMVRFNTLKEAEEYIAREVEKKRIRMPKKKYVQNEEVVFKYKK